MLPLLMVLQAYSQTEATVIISGIVADLDSVPIPDVVIVNARTGHTVYSDQKGFFQTHITGNDSLFIYHIAYQRRFITEKDNGRTIILQPDMNEINQVDVNGDYMQELKYLQQTLEDIKRTVPMEKLSEEEMKSRETRFVEQHGSHNKGFMPFFGPTMHLYFGKIAQMAGLDKQSRERKKLTSHYHLLKKKSNEKEE